MKVNFLLFLVLVFTSSCTSMKTLDSRADAFINYWQGKTLEEFVKRNPEIDPYQVVDLGRGNRRHVFRYRESLTAEEFAYAIVTSDSDAKLVRFIYLFVNADGIIYDATWQRKLIK